MNSRWTDRAIAVWITVAAAYFAGHGVVAACSAPTTRTVQTCQEDDPCWDCRTMGNRICGPITTTTPSTHTTPRTNER